MNSSDRPARWLNRVFEARRELATPLAFIAVFLAAGGPSHAQALVQKITGAGIADNAVSSRHIRDDSIVGSHVRNGSLKGKDLAGRSIPGKKLKRHSVGSQEIKSGTLRRKHFERAELAKVRGERGQEGPPGGRGPEGPRGLAGSDAQFSGASAGGDLEGSFPNPTLKDGAANPPPGDPSSEALPYDGQELYYLADAANGIWWHFRYRAMSSSPYKWEFIGGSDLVHEVDDRQTTTSTSYVDLTTVGPTLTLPLAGVYDIEWGCRAFNSVAADYWFMTPKLGAAAAGDGDGLTARADAGSHDKHLMRRIRRTLAANDVVKAQYRVTGTGTGDFSMRHMAIRPVRVG